MNHGSEAAFDPAQSAFDQSGAVWLNAPQSWSLEAGALSLVTDAHTDFWQDTHYSFRRDTGHFFGVPAADGFTAEVRIRADYQQLYDQAGIMVRIDERQWVKAGIELSDGRAMLSSVMTVDRSDWATAAYAQDAGDVRMRATVARGVLRLQVSSDGVRWPLVRLAPFPSAQSYLVGPMACSPQGEGLAVTFSDFRLTASLAKDLHDLS